MANDRLTDEQFERYFNGKPEKERCEILHGLSVLAFIEQAVETETRAKTLKAVGEYIEKHGLVNGMTQSLKSGKFPGESTDERRWDSGTK